MVLIAELYTIVYICQNFYIHYSVKGHLGPFQLLAIKNKVAMNIVEHVSLLHVGTSSGYMPRSGIAGSSGETGKFKPSIGTGKQKNPGVRFNQYFEQLS